MSTERHSNRELQIVGFQVGNETYGVPITALHEIVRVPEITAVPDAPEYMEGVINLRGKIVSVIDSAQALWGEGSSREPEKPDSGGRVQRAPVGADRRFGVGGPEDCGERH